MAAKTVQQQMVFMHRHEDIAPFLKEVTLFVDTHLPQASAQLLPKAKAIVIELLTNSIKHAGNGQTAVELILDNDQFIITKTDTGQPFYLKQNDTQVWPSANIAKSSVKIYADALNGLFAHILSANTLSFYTESYEGADDIILDLSEHYGLMIICRASDNFVYEFDQTSLKNTFTVIIQLN